jgi:hypothetical protein
MLLKSKLHIPSCVRIGMGQGVYPAIPHAMAAILTEPVLAAKQPLKPLPWLQMLHVCAGGITDLRAVISWMHVFCATLVAPHVNGEAITLSV